MIIYCSPNLSISAFLSLSLSLSVSVFLSLCLSPSSVFLIIIISLAEARQFRAKNKKPFLKWAQQTVDLFILSSSSKLIRAFANENPV